MLPALSCLPCALSCEESESVSGCFHQHCGLFGQLARDFLCHGCRCDFDCHLAIESLRCHARMEGSEGEGDRLQLRLGLSL